MTKKMKKSLLAVSVLATSFSVLGAVASLDLTNGVNAQAEYVAPVDFETRFGASIRVSDPNGLRFKLQLSNDKKNEVFADDNKTLGMFIFPKSKIKTADVITTVETLTDGSNQTIKKVDYSKLLETGKVVNITFAEGDLYEQDGCWVANGVLGDMYIQNYNIEFVCVGYIKTGDTYEYSDFNVQDNVRSLSGVATQAYKADDLKTKAAEFIEKSVYAQYGVKESRSEGTYTFTVQGQEPYTAGDSWTAYNAMKAANPISISVAQVGTISIGETAQLLPTFKIGGNEYTVADYPFTYTVSSDVAVCNENGVITATKAGTAEITVSMGSVYATTSVTVRNQTVQRLPAMTYYANRQTQDGLSIDFSAYNLSGVAKLKLDGVPYGTISGNTATATASDLKSVEGGVKKLTLTDSNDVVLASGEITYVNFAIGSATELNDFRYSYIGKANTADSRTQIYTYAVLTDNIDLTGYNNDGALGYGHGTDVFYGCIDGQGYSISNFTVSNGLFWNMGRAGAKTSVLKNIGVYNAKRALHNTGGIFGEELTNMQVDNVYVQYQAIETAVGNASQRYVAAIAAQAKDDVSFTNCFVDAGATIDWATYGALVAVTHNKAKVDNCYALYETDVIGDQYKYLYSELYTAMSESYNHVTIKDGVYTTKSAFKAEVTSVPRGFDTNYWTMKDGMLTFKSTQGTWLSLEDEYMVAGNKVKSFDLDLSKYSDVIASINSVTIGGTAVSGYTYTPATYKLSVPFANITARGDVDVVISGKTQKGTTLIVNALAQVVDIAIADINDLNAFGDFCNVGASNKTPYTYVVLTANINYNNGLWSDVYSNGAFSGIFDGQGYTISNVRVVNSFFPALNKTGEQRSVLKNFGLINVVKHSQNGGGLLVNDLLYTDVDNVYVSGRVELYTNPNVCGAFAGTSINSTLSNSVAFIEYVATQDTMPTLIGQVRISNTSISNVHVISASATKEAEKEWVGLVQQVDANNATPGSYTVTNVNRYDTAVAFKTAVTKVPETFNTELWTMKDNMLAFKSGAWITIAQTQVLAKNRTQQIDLAKYNVNTVTSVTIGTKAVYGYTFDGGKLNVPIDELGFKTTESVDSYITATTDSGDVTIAFSAQVVDYAIGDANELNDLGAMMLKSSAFVTGEAVSSTYLYVILTDNVNYNNANFTTANGAKSFNGIFDGQGYTISNMAVNHGFFSNMLGVAGKPVIIKDLGLVNVIKNTGQGGGLLGNCLKYVEVRNVFVSGVLTNNSSGSVYGYGTNVTIENCIIDIYSQSGKAPATNTADSTKTGFLSASVQSNTTVSNVFGVLTGVQVSSFYHALNANQTNINMTKYGHYNSLTLFKNGIKAVPTGFDLTLWEMQGGLLVFRSAGADGYLSK